MNKCIFTSRLTKDPELKTLQSGTTVCNFSIAVDRKFKKEGQPTVDFFNCIAFGKPAEFVAKYFTKGKPICVEGSLQNRNWEDQAGQKHYVTEVMVDSVEFCGDKGNNDSSNTMRQENQASQSDFIDVSNEDDLPF